MNLDGRPASDNVFALRHGVELLRALDDTHYAGKSRPGISSVGAQIRHCIDFYDCFLSGLRQREIDYNRRERDRRVEVDRGVAIERMRQLIDALEGLEAEATEWAVRVRSERSPASVGAAAWCRSSVRRELEFLLSHTVHHYALIVELLRLQEVELDERFAEFGVAPSTLDYWRESGSNAG